MNDASDAELLWRYLNDGEELAFTDVVRRYPGPVYQAALRHFYGAMLTQSAGILSATQVEALRKVTEQKCAVVRKAVRNTTSTVIQFSPVRENLRRELSAQGLGRSPVGDTCCGSPAGHNSF